MLETYSFWWSEARLILGAIALLLGGVPVVLAILPISGLYSLAGSLLTLAWIISGVASGYMLYRFWTGGKMIFGGRKQRDIIAFLVSIITGFNLGITGFLGTNIGMSLSSNRIVFTLAAVVYVIAAAHLYRRWNASGKKIFAPVPQTPPTPASASLNKYKTKNPRVPQSGTRGFFLW